MDNDRRSNFMAGPLPPPKPAVPQEQLDAQREALGSWAIIRKGRRSKPPRVRKYRNAEAARKAWDKLDIREGWGALVDPEGATIARSSGPFGVRTRW